MQPRTGCVTRRPSPLKQFTTYGAMARHRCGIGLVLLPGWCTHTGCYRIESGVAMKIISCIKPVPDPGSRLVVNESKTWIKDQDLTFVASEADNYALEEALRLKEKHGGEVVVLSMGGEEAARVLRSGLAMGADRAIHLLDPKF